MQPAATRALELAVSFRAELPSTLQAQHDLSGKQPDIMITLES
jgi:hypothetical protein